MLIEGLARVYHELGSNLKNYTLLLHNGIKMKSRRKNNRYVQIIHASVEKYHLFPKFSTLAIPMILGDNTLIAITLWSASLHSFLFS
jgi:hypothetical protein